MITAFSTTSYQKELNRIRSDRPGGAGDNNNNNKTQWRLGASRSCSRARG